MKKKIITAILAISCIGLSVGSVFANTDCPVVSVQMVGTSPSAASGLFCKVKNESGAACGDMANGASRIYFLNTSMTDQTYATLLTAFSLQKKMWIQVGGTGTNNSLLYIATVSN